MRATKGMVYNLLFPRSSTSALVRWHFWYRKRRVLKLNSSPGAKSCNNTSSSLPSSCNKMLCKPGSPPTALFGRVACSKIAFLYTSGQGCTSASEINNAPKHCFHSLPCGAALVAVLLPNNEVGKFVYKGGQELIRA